MSRALGVATLGAAMLAGALAFGASSLYLPSLRSGDRRVRIDVRFERRGGHALAPTRVAIRDPLGLAERELRSAPLEVLVLPRIERVLAPRAGGSSGAGRVARAALDTTELEPDG